MLLHGEINLNKRIRKHPVWNREPKCYAAAWADLLLLANDAPRTVFLHGEPIALERGQLAWSKQSLEEEWSRSDAWVRTFLNFCQDQTMITVKSSKRGTIITILNYDAYNPPLVSGSASDLVSGSASDLEQKRETGKGNKETGKGEGAPPPGTDIPTDAEVAEFCAAFQDLALGIQGIPNVWWTGWLANRLNDTGRPFPRDWKRSLALAFRSDFANRHPKALANFEKNGGGHKLAATTASPAQALFLVDRELAEVNGEIEEMDGLNKPVPAVLKQRRRDLEKKRAEILQQQR